MAKGNSRSAPTTNGQGPNDGRLQKHLQWLAERSAKAAADAEEAAKQAQEDDAAQPLQLALWPDSVRAVPNAVLRGALFTISKQRQVVNKRTLLASVKGVQVRFKGERFNQTDLDVWETILHFSRTQNLGTKVYFTAHSLLSALGRHHGKEQHEQLKEDIARLTSGVVEITSETDGQTFGGSMVQAYYRDDGAQMYVVELSPQLVKLYQAGNTYIDWSERQELGSAHLAKWLHGFYSSHAQPMPYKVATIRELCGAKPTQRLGDFRKLLRAALELLMERTMAIVGWHIDDNDLLHIQRRATKSQVRHLQKKEAQQNLQKEVERFVQKKDAGQ